jgi:Flp pilus assembly CpaE family ATPase
MSIPVVTAADGAAWEADLIADFANGGHDIEIVRRCVDVIDLLAVASAGQALAVVADAKLRRLDSDAVDRLIAAGVAVIGVSGVDQFSDEALFRRIGVTQILPWDAPAGVAAAVIRVAISDISGAGDAGPGRAYADPAFASGRLQPATTGSPVETAGTGAASVGEPGSVVAVWGPAGAPGRSTVAITLADELARLLNSAYLIDADVYGGVVAASLGVLDESPGIAAACRQAQTGRLDATSLAAVSWQIHPTLRVLTGLSRPDRWPELRTSAVERVLSVARSLARFTVVDVGFSLESDEELTFDSLAPRRNGATLTILDHADLVLVVASADPIGIQRLVRGLSELRDAEITAPVWIVLNRVRRGAVPGDPAAELDRALERFVGKSAAALLPYDRAGLDLALSEGKTLGEAVPTSPLRRAVGELASAVAGVGAPVRGRRRK